MVCLLSPKGIVEFGELLQSGVNLSDEMVKLLKQRDTEGEPALPEGTKGEQAPLITAASKK